ncbi:DNA-dependent RNA polymerase auxiliary subunit epsilon [Cytobacillus eiseniae]|uniref:DNA-directed RNA polymerase subunit epsilon n=1 Tax=Cytobacillus eiseniae TaxID=762947 RepID=A0ABS4RDP1_9BACI|nr:DNA-directed RNA polymerase subunit epsilon [Cytobacillus eiseniae]MBP2239957.1 DNA-dependent RNA polymerase auxiliary subunit epsilon [Cytobacillus eiseniae]
MIFKVYFQDSKTQVPVREKTKTIYLEGKSERDVRIKLKNKPYNIEFITGLEGAFLEYEKQNEDFKVLEIE